MRLIDVEVGIQLVVIQSTRQKSERERETLLFRLSLVLSSSRAIFPIEERFVARHVLSSFRCDSARVFHRFRRSQAHRFRRRDQSLFLVDTTNAQPVNMFGISSFAMTIASLFVLLLVVNQCYLAHSFRLMHDDLDQVRAPRRSPLTYATSVAGRREKEHGLAY